MRLTPACDRRRAVDGRRVQRVRERDPPVGRDFDQTGFLACRERRGIDEPAARDEPLRRRAATRLGSLRAACGCARARARARRKAREAATRPRLRREGGRSRVHRTDFPPTPPRCGPASVEETNDRGVPRRSDEARQPRAARARAAAMLVREGIEKRRARLGAHREHHAHACISQTAEREPHHRRRRCVEPLDVVDRDDDLAVCCQLSEQRAEGGAEQSPLRWPRRVDPQQCNVERSPLRRRKRGDQIGRHRREQVG